MPTDREIGEEEIPDPLIIRIVDQIVSDGAEFPSEGRWGSPISPTAQQEANNGADGGTPTSGSGDGDDIMVGQSGSRNAASKSDEWGEADPDAEGWDDPVKRRRASSGSGSRRNSGGRGRRGGRRRRGSSSSSGQDGAAAVKAAAAAVVAVAAAEAEEEATNAGTAGGEGYGGVLTYEWHSKMYLGAAHGVSGILFVLMQGERRYCVL